MHGETFEIPQDAELIYRGDELPSQAIFIGSALGLQFHLELALEMIKDWVNNRPIKERKFVLAQSRPHLTESQRICRIIGDRFLSATSCNFTWVGAAGKNFV